MSEQAQTIRRKITPAEAKRLKVNLVRVAGLAAVLSLLMEGLQVVGGEPASIAGLLDHGLWPYLVCMAVAIGQAMVGGWPTKAGAFALVATPIAFLLAKVIQKGFVVLTSNEAPGGFI